MSKIKVYVVGGDLDYAKFITRKYKIVKKPENAHIAIFTGGEDVSPDYYGEPKGSKTYNNSDRDSMESSIYRRLRRANIPMVGICRGAQFLTVMSGGSLIQDVSGHATGKMHKIRTLDENRVFEITSTHHQMMYPYQISRNEFKIIASSAENLSSRYLNGYDDSIKLKEDFVEPEIVYYCKTNCLCIQGHPEYMPKTSTAVKYINMLLDELFLDGINLNEDEDESAVVDDDFDEIEAREPIANRGFRAAVENPAPIGLTEEQINELRNLIREANNIRLVNRENNRVVDFEDINFIL